MNTDDIINLYKEKFKDSAGKAVTLLDNSGFRNAIYDSLYDSLTPDDGPLLRTLLCKEIKQLEGGSEEDSLENLYKCGLLLYRIGDVKDVMELWRAKTVAYDVRQRFEVQFLVGAGVDTTICYLKSRNDDDAKEVLAYLLKCLKRGKFRDLEVWFEFRMLFVRPDLESHSLSPDSLYCKLKAILRRLI